MTCTEFLNLLDDLLDDKLAAEVRADLDQHLYRCVHCEVIFNTTQKTIEIYQSHEIYDLPSDLRERLHTAIIDGCKKGASARGSDDLDEKTDV